jgi:hypothetical protein
MPIALESPLPARLMHPIDMRVAPVRAMGPVAPSGPVITGVVNRRTDQDPIGNGDERQLRRAIGRTRLCSNVGISHAS